MIRVEDNDYHCIIFYITLFKPKRIFFINCFHKKRSIYFEQFWIQDFRQTKHSLKGMQEHAFYLDLHQSDFFAIYLSTKTVEIS